MPDLPDLPEARVCLASCRQCPVCPICPICSKLRPCHLFGFVSPVPDLPDLPDLFGLVSPVPSGWLQILNNNKLLLVADIADIADIANGLSTQILLLRVHIFNRVSLRAASCRRCIDFASVGLPLLVASAFCRRCILSSSHPVGGAFVS